MQGETVEREEWRPIPGAEGFYSVSSLGRVRSESRPESRVGRQRGRILTPSKDTKGYSIFRLCIPGKKQKTTKVHRVVAAAFIGTPEEGWQVNHINGDKSDNRVENLEYVSCQENIRHCWDKGLHGIDHCQGEANPNTKLTAEDVRTIRKLYPGLSLSILGSLYGVTKQTIANIVKRRTWAHVA